MAAQADRIPSNPFSFFPLFFLFLHLPILPSFHSSIHHPSIIYPSIHHPSICIYTPIHPSVHLLSTHPSISIHPSIHSLSIHASVTFIPSCLPPSFHFPSSIHEYLVKSSQTCTPNLIKKKKIQPAMCLHHEIANRNLISFTQRETIKPQQLSRYLALQRPGIEGDLPGGEVGLEKPGTWGKGPQEVFPQPLPPAPPRPRPGCLYANHPGASFAYPSAHFHIPQLWVTAATFVFRCHPGSCSFILRTGEGGRWKRKRREKKEKGREKTPQDKEKAPSG